MANHGSVGNKFLSANVSKGYGQSSHFHHPSYSGSSYGQAAAGRGRPTHAGGGSGMVVLSRPRSSQKSVPKLSVPPPLNLPSMRKEHEKFDLTGTGGSAIGGSGSGTGSGPNSSSMGWTKPAAPPVKDGTTGSQVVDGVDQSVIATDAGSKGSNAYVQPLARVNGVGQPVNSSGQAYPSRVEKAMVLRGEDFPSLQAALPLPPASGSVQKQKDSFQKKNQQLVQEDSLSPKEQSDSYRLSSPVDTRPHGQSSHPRVASESKEGGFNRFGGSRMNDQPRKPEYFPGPLPLVRLNPRSDWADDERDTGHGITERGREHGISKTEAYWDRDFELPRSSLLPHKPPTNVFERSGLRREEIGKGFPSDILKVDTDHRELRTPSREGSEGKSWRSAIQKDVQQVANDRNDLGRPTGVIRDTSIENKYTPPFGANKVNLSSTYMRADIGHGQNRNNTTGSYSSRGGERNTRDRYGGEQSNRNGIDDFNKFNASKSSFSPGGKGFPIHDPILNFGREKRVSTKSERPYVEDPFLKEFASTGYDGSDPFSAGLVGVIKRKKDAVKPNDFHDPVRESFEAELERVQKMQEMERQRIIDEQERALEQARREEEERQRLIREEEERQRRLEEESREAAWRAEQERLDAIRKAEELKIAREEEKRRIFFEEERRKEAAKQKLLELEASIARRQAETAGVDNSNSATAVSDEAVFGGVKEKYISREAESDSWEDGERMVERITTSASSDSSISNRPFDMNPRPHVDGGKFVNSWRRDVFDNGNTSSFPRYMPSRAYFKEGVQELHVDEFAPLKEHGWSPYGDGAESEFYENVGDRYAMGWGQGQRWYPNSDADDFYAYGRPRFSMRQPRVLPPPSLPSFHKASSIGGGDNERPGPSNSQVSEVHYSTSRSESTLQSNEPKLEKDSGPRCDSQSSLSVSSPPTSPTQLSHDELEDSTNSMVKPPAAEVKETNLYNETTFLNENAVKGATLSAQSSVSGGEDEEWTLDNNEELQEQEEYDEDEDGYQEDDEVHANDMTREFDELEGKDSSHMNNLVLGFDEGVEVGIPSDELERESRSEEGKFEIPEVSENSILEERGYTDNLQGDGQSIHHVDVPIKIHETENTVEESITQSVIAPQSSTTHDILDNVVSSSVETASISSSGQAIPVVSSVQSQADLPLKLQFGLFSGPSLIPSPVPAIQIGSIQMPLHLHPPVGPSIGHTHPSQAPLFQFGQLRYTSPVPQGVLPVGHQSVSFVQPNIQAHYNMNQNSGASLPMQPNQDTSAHSVLKIAENGVRRLNSFTVGGNVENDTRSRTQISNATEGNRKNESSLEKNHDLPSLSGGKDFNVSKNNQGCSYGNKGKKVNYSVKNSGFRSSFRASDDPRSDSSGFQRRPQRAIQRTEFRVRESTNKNQNQPSGSVSSNLNLDAKPNRNGKGVGYNGTGFKRGTVPNKPTKQIGESESSSSGPIISQEAFGKETSTKHQAFTISQEDADAPIQSGIVRVYEQPGIEAPSDEDDFIEVRSKRQMLNDRREQREKEIKAKSRVAKPPRKPRSSASNTGVSNNSNKISVSLGGEGSNSNINSDFVVSEGQGLVNEDGSTCFPSIVSQLLAPIGTPSVNADTSTNSRARSIKSNEAGSASVISGGTKDLGPTRLFDTKNNVLDNVQASLGSWGNAQINQQVMSLTQTQLDEAMKPARFDSHVPPICGQTSVTEPLLPSPSSILAKEKSISSSSSPISSLLAGEKIQFGAVTSPTVLPPSSRVISHVIGAPGVFRSDIHNLSQAENDCTLFYGKDKHTNESHLEDSEVEAEAAASAVAAAAISSDEIVGNGNVSNNTKSFRDSDVDGITGVTSGTHSGSQSRTEESLSVSLPADLSVETQPISLWPAVPGPQNSSNPMLSHFPGAPPPSHFPFYDMNSMLGGPIFTFGPHEESSGTQSQPQKTVMPAGPGHIGNWQQVHSPVDSFYGPPAGFAGPFISPPGGIPGVQPPPHMVVYNHYAPVGQFGQVGLSFMGTTYVPSGKQPDWKHNPASSMGMGEGGMNNMNLVSAQRNPPNMPNPIQHHLAPRSPILPIASPMAMFDVSPFQTAQDMSVQARWSHVPAPPPLNSVPLSLPKQQPEGEGVVLPSQFNHGHHVDQSLAPPHRFSEPQGSTPTDKSTTCPVVTKPQFPNEFGLVVDSSTSTVTGTSTQGQSSTGKTKDTVQSDNSNSSSGQSVNVNNSFKNQQKNLSGHQYNNHSGGYGYHRGGSSQKSGSSGEWAHRRMGGFHGRNQSLGAEKNFSNSKMKQVYVAKQTRSGPSTVG